MIEDADHRKRLPDRRMNIAHAVIWDNRTWLFQVGFDADGKAREVFVDGVKVGQDMDTLMDDVCVTLSLLLQSGFDASALRQHLCREGVEGQAAASLLGKITLWMEEIEAEAGDGIRQAYAASAPGAPTPAEAAGE